MHMHMHSEKPKQKDIWIHIVGGNSVETHTEVQEPTKVKKGSKEAVYVICMHSSMFMYLCQRDSREYLSLFYS